MIVKSNPLISIIVPIYKVEKYIDICIKSIITQTYTNLEIILIDDESPDKCPQICDAYKEKDRRIRVVHKKNGGLGFARNSGLDIATGDFVMFLDSDDYLDCDTIESLVKEFLKSKSQLVKAGFRKVDDEGKILYERKYSKSIFEDKYIDANLTPRFLGSSPSKSDSVEMSVWATLYDRRIIEENHLRFDSEREVVSEDLPFNLSFLSHCNNAVLSDKIIYNYRFNPRSLSQSYLEGKFLRIVKFFEIIEKRFPDLICRENIRFSRLFFLFVKKYIKGELLDKESSQKEIVSRIKKICVHPMVIDKVSHYPISKLPIKQQTFLRLVKGKHSQILYILAKMNIY